MPLAFQPWYLDAVSGQAAWNICISEIRGTGVAVWPYVLKRKYGLSYITSPYLSPYLGPWYTIFDNVASENILNIEFELLNSLLDQIPDVNYIQFQLEPCFQNWLPFYHRNYSQTTRYSYRIDLKLDENSIWNNISSRQKNLITDLHQERIIQSDDIEFFYSLLEITFKRRNIAVPYSKNWLTHFYSSLRSRNKGSLYFFLNENEIPISGLLVSHDHSTTFLLATAKDYRINENYSVSNLIWYVIRDSKKKSEIFDFEGSMIKGVEFFFRSFGAQLRPYMSLQKICPSILRVPLLLSGKIS